ncbi:MAG: DUF6350 family protein [Microbacteriaceae bacterium]
MNRLAIIGQSILESLLVFGIGLGIPTLTTTLMWGFHYELSIDWSAFWFVAVLAWLGGLGVASTIHLDQEWLGMLGLSTEQSAFTISLPLLGLLILTLYLSRNAGRRIAHHRNPWVSSGVAVLCFALLSFAAAITVPNEFAEVSVPAAVLVPTLWFAAALLFGMAQERSELLAPLSQYLDGLIPTQLRNLLRDGLRGGTIAVLAVLALSSFVAAGLVFWNGLEIVSLYEALHAGIMGGVVITVAQIFLLPNLIIWSLSWFAGPGFSIGVATQVSPLGTQLGPVPALPIFGAIPAELGGWGFIAFIVPISAGFLAALLLKRRELSRMYQLATAASLAIFSGVQVFILATLASGSIGPGRMIEVGVDAPAAAFWFALLVLIGGAVGMLSRDLGKIRGRKFGPEILAPGNERFPLA